VVDWTPTRLAGFYTTAELQVVHPWLSNGLVGAPVFPDGTSHTISPPASHLNWTVSPLLELGWRLNGNLGQFGLSYRFLDADGSQGLALPGGTSAQVHSRLAFTVIDFDYQAVPVLYGAWAVVGRVGVRAGTAFFDSNQSATGDIQYDSNNFYGAGPHGRIDLYRQLGFLPGLSLFGRADGAVLVGETQQRFSEQLTAADGTLTSGNFNKRRTTSVPIINFQAGLSYTPPRLNNWHFTAGYIFEEWLDVGSIQHDPSHGRFNLNGVFTRLTVDF
jgi:hypothetical protein